MKTKSLFYGAAAFLAVSAAVPCFADPMVFPAPREMTAAGGGFAVDDQVKIVIPAQPSREDISLAGFLTTELADRFDVHLKTERAGSLSVEGRMIVMGAVSNPLIAAYCARNHIEVTAANPGAEGYVLRVEPNVVVIAGSDERGAFWGLQSLRQLATGASGAARIAGVQIRDWPGKPFRGVKLYLPGRENIPFFKRFVRDFMALYKYNTLMMEMNASMRLDRHPELNQGWLEFNRDTNYSRRNYPPGPIHDMEQNSSHQDTADGGFLEKAEVADLAHWVRQYHIELVPELPAFTHSYYLLTRHKELSEVPGMKWPDTYCPSNPKSYELLFDVYDEYIDLLKPRMIHAGHDELFQPVGLCPRCGNKDIGERYGEDVKKIHDYLAGKGIQMAIWGDMLLQEVRGKGLQPKKAPDGFAYNAPGGMTPDQVARLIPKDILMFNWFWHGEPGEYSEEKAEHNEARLDEMGFKQVFGNFTAGIENYDSRGKRKTIVGGAPSAWFATNEVGFGKELLPDFLGCSSVLWNGRVVKDRELSALVQSLAPEIRARFRGAVPPSRTEDSIAAKNIAEAFNSGPAEPKLAIDLGGMKTGTVKFGKVPFEFADAGGKSAVIVASDGKDSSGLAKEAAVPIGEDATSLIFLHASAKPAANREGYRVIWDQEDTADLLGWYEVIYEDGFVSTIPIRYGVNIQEWSWEKRTTAGDYCYGADAVDAGNGITLFAFEWTNPRLGKVIKEVRLKGTSGFRGADPGFTNDYGPVIPTNGVILKAVSVVKKRA